MDILFCQPNEQDICIHCKIPLKKGFMRNCSSVIITKSSEKELGDIIEQMLASVGVTEEWYKSAKESIGLPPECWCPERKEWLNRASRWWKSIVNANSID